MQHIRLHEHERCDLRDPNLTAVTVSLFSGFERQVLISTAAATRQVAAIVLL